MWFEIFKVGKWHGKEYSKDDLDKMVENFEKGDPKVPLIIGHNSFWGGEEKPAEGWVEQLKRSGNRLMARARNVTETLKAAVNEERYPMRSVELWHDYHGRGIALGAIAFLGGSNPEVGGMADFQFSKGAGAGYMMQSKDGERTFFAFESTDKFTEEPTLPGIHHQRGGDDMTKEEIQKLISDGIAEGVNQFKSGPEFTQLQADNARLTKEATDAKQHATAVAVQADLNGCIAFAKDLLDNKKVTPAQHGAGLGAFLASLDDTDEIQFAGDKKQTRRAFAKDLLGNLPGKGSLFAKVDDDEPRAGEDDNISDFVQKFAAANGLDPKIVAQHFAAQRKQFSGHVPDAEDEVSVTGVSVSIGAAKAPTA